MVTATMEIHDNNYYDTFKSAFHILKKGVWFLDNWSQFNQKYYL